MILLLLAFVAPVLVALAMHTPWLHYDPQATKNYGTLFDPSPKLSGWLPASATAPLEGAEAKAAVWTLTYVAEAGCDNDCLAAVDLLQRVWAAQGQERDRVRLLYALPGGAEAPALEPVWISQQRDDTVLPAAARVLLIDPEGYGATWYPAAFDGTELRKDLRHLLKWSKSGR
jgi:hypothetical protein